MKILFIGSLPPPYHGVTVQNQRLLNSKLQDIFKIIHLDTTDKRDLNNLGKIDIGNIWLGISHLFRLLSLVIRNRPDIIYLTVAQNTVAFLRDGLFILLSKIFSRAKVVIHFRGGNYYNFYSDSLWLLRKFMDLVYNYSDYGIVLGKNLISMVSKWFDEKKIFVIPNGTDFFVDISKRKKDFSEINIGYIGFLGPEKGTYELLNIFEELSTEYSDIKLILAGEFAYGNIEFKEDFLKKIATSKYKHNIILSGKIIDKQKQDFFLNTDIFAFPSWIEGHPNVILEAMAASCPIVASDVGAVSESVLDGYNGFLVPAREEGKFKVKLSELIKNEELRKKMGENSFLLYKEKFTSDINIDKIINAFQIAGTEQCV